MPTDLFAARHAQIENPELRRMRLGSVTIEKTTWPVLLAALIVLAVSTPARAVDLQLWTDKTSYEVGESIVVTLSGDTTGAPAAQTVSVGIVYSTTAPVDGIGAVATQDTITSFGGAIPWSTANPACGTNGCLVFNQLSGAGPLTPDPDTIIGTLTIPTVAEGILTISPDATDFFGATAPSPVTVIVGGQEVASVNDGIFNNSHWGLITVESGCESFSTGQVASGGNTGAFRRTDRTCSGDFSQFFFYQWELSQFNPATMIPSGEALAIAYCEDGYRSGAPAGTGIYGAFMFYQGINLYAGPPIPITSSSWTQQCQFPLRAEDFVLIDGVDPQPDFTSSGALLRFGHGRWVEGSSPTSVTFYEGIDNFDATFLVPEPPGGLGLVCGVILLNAMARRRRGDARAARATIRV